MFIKNIYIIIILLIVVMAKGAPLYNNLWVWLLFALFFAGIIICIVYNAVKSKTSSKTTENFKVLGGLAKFDRTDVLPSGDLVIRSDYSDGLKYAEQADPRKYLKSNSIAKGRYIDGLFSHLAKTGGSADFPNCTTIGVKEALSRESNDPMIEAGKIERMCDCTKQCMYSAEYRPGFMSFDDFMSSCSKRCTGRIA